MSMTWQEFSENFLPMVIFVAYIYIDTLNPTLLLPTVLLFVKISIFVTSFNESRFNTHFGIFDGSGAGLAH